MDPALAYLPLAWQLAVRDLREAPQLPGQAGLGQARGSSPRSHSRYRTRSAGRQDVHVHDPQRFPLLAAVERAGHRADLQVHDRAHPQPDHEELRPPADYLGDVVGAQAYMSGKAAHICGIVARGNTLTVRLTVTRARIFSPAWRCRSSAPSRSTRPLDPKGVRAIPSAGPYYVASVHARAGRRAGAQPELPRQPSRIDFDRIVARP